MAHPEGERSAGAQPWRRRKPTPSPVGFANSKRCVAGSRPFSSAVSPGRAAGFAAGAPSFAATPGLASRPGWWRWHAWLGAVPLAGYLLLHLGAQVWALA